MYVHTYENHTCDWNSSNNHAKKSNSETKQLGVTKIIYKTRSKKSWVTEINFFGQKLLNKKAIRIIDSMSEIGKCQSQFKCINVSEYQD